MFIFVLLPTAISIIHIEKSLDGVLGIQTRGAEWLVQMKPLSYGGRPIDLLLRIVLNFDPKNIVLILQCAMCTNNKSNGGAAMAPWFHLCLPSCGPGFESQAQHLCFFQFVLLKLLLELEKNENKQKEVGIGPYLKKIYCAAAVHAISSFQIDLCAPVCQMPCNIQ